MTIGTLSGEKSLGLVMDLCQRLRSGNRTLEELALFNEGRFGELAHTIDCDAEPYNRWIEDGWTVVEHKMGGKLIWDASKVMLYLGKVQKNSDDYLGNELRAELSDKPTLNANVLDYLLKNPHLIPKSWKGKYVHFWGTIYRSSAGDLMVRYLSCDNGQWGDYCECLDDACSSGSRAAVRTW